MTIIFFKLYLNNITYFFWNLVLYFWPITNCFLIFSWLSNLHGVIEIALDCAWYTEWEHQESCCTSWCWYFYRKWDPRLPFARWHVRHAVSRASHCERQGEAVLGQESKWCRIMGNLSNEPIPVLGSSTTVYYWYCFPLEIRHQSPWLQHLA